MENLQNLQNLNSEISEAINEAIETIQNIRRSHIERFEKAMALQNGDVPPNIDSDGRFHAPIDGYVDYLGNEYLKGQYLPTDGYDVNYKDSDDSKGSKGSKGSNTKYTVSVQIQDELVSYFKKLIAEESKNSNNYKSSRFNSVEFDLSRIWCYKGATRCYLMIISPYKTIANNIKTVVKAKMDKILDEYNKCIALNEIQKGPAPLGKETIKGKVLSVKPKEGYYTTTWKMMVELENKSTVWGSLPSKISDVKAGDFVEFTATFEYPENSEESTHAFFKRPTKASIIDSL